MELGAAAGLDFQHRGNGGLGKRTALGRGSTASTKGTHKLPDTLNSGHYNKVVNPGVGDVDIKISPEHLAIARESLSDVYDFCQERFGDALPKSWHV